MPGKHTVLCVAKISIPFPFQENTFLDNPRMLTCQGKERHTLATARVSWKCVRGQRQFTVVRKWELESWGPKLAAQVPAGSNTSLNLRLHKCEQQYHSACLLGLRML